MFFYVLLIKFSFIMGLLSGIFGALGQAISNRQQSKENQKNRDFAVEMFNRENEYNLPVNQMARFQQAGLNPNLVYGQGTSSLSATAQTPQTNTKYDNVGTAGVQAYFASKQIEMQQQVNDSVINRNNAEAEKLRSEAYGLGIENQYKPEILKKELEKLGYDVNIASYDSFIKEQSFGVQIEMMFQQLQEQLENVDIAREQKRIYAQEVLNKAQELVKLQNECQRILSEANYYNEQAKTEQSKRAEIAMMVKKLASDINRNSVLNQLSDLEMDKIDNEIEQMVANGNVERAVKLIYQRFGTSTAGVTATSIENKSTNFGNSPLTVKGVYIPRSSRGKNKRSYFNNQKNWKYK